MASRVSDDVKRAEERFCAAEGVMRDLEREIKAEIDQAAAEIRARHRIRTGAAANAVRDARLALTAAQDSAPAHEWDGKRVYRMKSVGRSWDRRPLERVEGIVETRRSSTEFPGNTAGYRLPAMGDGFVRLLKKDGSRGLQFDRLHSVWKLAEDTASPSRHLEAAQVSQPIREDQ